MMTEEKAREIKEEYESKVHETFDYLYDEYLTAKGFLAGIEAERKRAEGLVEALKKIADWHNTNPEGCDSDTPYLSAKEALAVLAKETEGRENQK